MAKNNLNLLLILFVSLIAIVSGCVGGQDVTSAVKALPEVQQFMNEHPNAKITVTYWSQDDVVKASQEINQQCDKPITPIAMYKATISEGDLKIVSWINAENQIVVCSITQGSGSSQIKNTTPVPIQTQTYTSTSNQMQTETSASTPTLVQTQTSISTPVSVQTETSTSIMAPTISIIVSNYPDTQIIDMAITHRGGDALKSGEWKLSIVPVGSQPIYITSSSDFSLGNRIMATTTTEGTTNLTNDVLTGSVPLSSGAKYDVKLVHIPSNAMLLDSTVEVS